MKSGIYLLLGSNQGNRRENLAIAQRAIGNTIGDIKKKSHIYKTAAWGKTDQPEFFNQVIEIETHLVPIDLLNQILQIENSMGRIRNEKWGPRIIDIDILFYNNDHVNMAELKVPHPGISQRKFTLVPLNEIATDLLHPVLKKNIATLLLECTDTSDVEPID